DKIQEARNFAEAIVSSVPVPLVVLANDLRVLTANPAFLSRFKYEPEATEQKGFFEIDNGRWNIAELRAHLKSPAEGGCRDFRQLELEFNDAEIGHCHLLVGGRQVTLEAQSLFLLAIEDVTPRKMAEIALKERTLELEVVNRAKSEFLANMSHELRTPLNAVIGFSEVLKDGIVDGELSARQKEYVTDIFNSGRHLLLLINDILDMSKIEAGKMSLELEPANVSALCESALRVVREKAAAHGITLDFNVDPTGDTPFLDVRKFRQIVYNLLSNAVKFTPDSGTVSLSTRRLAAQEMFGSNPDAVPNWQGDHFLELAVRDTGIGISSRDQERLFIPFEQVDGSISRKYEGTGLGLTMVKRLTELHGGWVNVESRVGEGSRFSVYLPWRKTLESEADFTVTPATESGPARHVSLSLLFLSGNRNLLDRIQAWPALGHHQVTALADYAQAWEWLNRHQAHAMLLDVDYPSLEGMRMLIQIKELPQFRTLPVILILETPSGGQGAVLAPSAVSLFPLTEGSLRPILDEIAYRNPNFDSAPGKRALLVDGDGQRRRQGKQVLESLGWSVDTAAGGLTGIDAALKGIPDLLVVSAVQPDISGFEVIQLLAERPETRRIPTVLMLEPRQSEGDLQALRPGLFALLGAEGADLERVSVVLSRLASGGS
ncbi:MAG: PAS domain-containing protein, partial [Candidatus Aminicenantes bacterium]|nr:PAS domain-containing protein [Candidatus Aminicenantes bacterium]